MLSSSLSVSCLLEVQLTNTHCHLILNFFKTNFKSNKLDFEARYKVMVNKAMFRIYSLYKILKTRDPQVLIRAFKVYVLPIIEVAPQSLIQLKRRILIS